MFSRRQMATTLLAAMINSEGDKEEKIRAAIEYTDKLLIGLSKPRGRYPDSKRMIPHELSDDRKIEVQKVAGTGQDETHRTPTGRRRI